MDVEDNQARILGVVLRLKRISKGQLRQVVSLEVLAAGHYVSQPAGGDGCINFISVTLVKLPA